MTVNDIFVKNFKMNSRKYVVLFTCTSFAIALFFMYTTIFLNHDINKEISADLRDILVAICIAIVFFTVCYFNYAYTSLLKSRNSEFGLLLSLGMITKDIRRTVFIENTIIVLTSFIFGLLVGTIFSKLFFLGVIKVLDADFINYNIGIQNYLMTLGIFTLIYICVITVKNQRIKKLDVIELINSEKTGEHLNLFHPIFGVIGMLFILLAYGIVYTDAMRVTRIPEKSTYFTVLCFTGLYLVISQIGKLFLKVSKRLKNYYIKNMLSITEIDYKLSRNKDMIYILTLLVAMTLFFLSYSYSKYIIAKASDGNYLVFISSFLATLFFAAYISVIYFKLFSDIREERIRYQKLNCIGITKNELKCYVNYELNIIFFLPIAFGMLLVIPYMSIEYINSVYLNQVLLSLFCIFVGYIFFIYLFSLVIKRKYIEEIMK